MTATDQAAEADLRARLQAKIRVGHCLDDSEDGDVNFCGNCDWCLHILAERALATQPATSQEGEVLREAITRALQCTPSISPAGYDEAKIIYDCGDPWEILREALAAWHMLPDAPEFPS